MHNSYFTISKENWTKVLEKVDKLPERDIYYFILRSLANAQQVSYYSIAAFNKELTDNQDHTGQSNNIFISNITKTVNYIMNDSIDKNSSWYVWHTTDKAWLLGWESFNNLRSAFKKN
jgi:hypothetical protein|tara:strand:- start:581 stop:934 length:354 start_codon:yes stop_codon:yes gene_type:complete